MGAIERSLLTGEPIRLLLTERTLNYEISLKVLFFVPSAVAVSVQSQYRVDLTCMPGLRPIQAAVVGSGKSADWFPCYCLAGLPGQGGSS